MDHLLTIANQQQQQNKGGTKRPLFPLNYVRLGNHVLRRTVVILARRVKENNNNSSSCTTLHASGAAPQSLRADLVFQIIFSVHACHYLFSWRELRQFRPLKPRPLTHVRRAKLLLKNELKVEFISYIKDTTMASVSDVGLDTPTVLFLHGGGFSFGSVRIFRRWLRNCSRTLDGIRFFAVDYTLSPEAVFPVSLKQALDAYLWLISPLGGGVSPHNVILAGDSAGGNLAVALLMVLRQMRLTQEIDVASRTDPALLATGHGDGVYELPTLRAINYDTGLVKHHALPFALDDDQTDIYPPMPRAVMLFSPWIDLTERSCSFLPESWQRVESIPYNFSVRMALSYLGLEPLNTPSLDKANKYQAPVERPPPDLVSSPYVSPLYGDMKGLPPILISVGQVEPIAGDILQFHQKCVSASVEAELFVGRGMNHDFQFFLSAGSAPDPELGRYWSMAHEWVKRQLVQSDASAASSGAST